MFLNLKMHAKKGLSLMLVGNLISTVLNVFIIKLLTNKFSTADFGSYSLIMSFTAFPQIVLFAPLSASIFPFFKNRCDKGHYRLFQKDIFDIFFFINIGLLLLTLFFYLSNLLLNIWPTNIANLLILAMIFSSTISALTILDTFSLAHAKIKEFTFFPIFNLLLKLILIAIIFKANITPYQMILLFSFVQAGLFVFELYYLKKKKIINYIPQVNLKSIFDVNTESKREIFKYSANFCLWGFFAWMQSFSDKWILQKNASSTDVAIYAIYFQYGFFPFTILSSVISQYISPLYFSRLGNQESLLDFMKKLLKFTVVFSIAMLVALPLISYYISPIIVKLLTNEQYLAKIHLFPIIVFAGCFFCFAQILAVPLLNAALVKQVRLPKIMSSVIAVILFWFLVPQYGILGIIATLVIINLLYFLIIFIYNLKYLFKLKLQVEPKT